MYFLGIDIGSLSCDAVLIDENKKVLASSVVPTGARNREAIERATNEVLRAAGVSEKEIKSTISTGYGRKQVHSRAATVTEITCHAKGIHTLLPQTRVLIDIGGQDSKVIRLNDNGKVSDFAMNDKCAAGTGRFLEAMARALQVYLEQMGDLDQGAEGKITMSSMCTVFSESEVVSLIADGVAVNEIVHGLNRAIATRVFALVRRVASNFDGLEVAMSGGVAHNAGVIRALSKLIGHQIAIPDKPDTVGALGAALIAQEKSK